MVVLEISLFGIGENAWFPMPTHIMNIKNRGRPTKSIISQQLLISDIKTGYQIKAKALAFHLLIKYTNYLIYILKNINENPTNEVNS